MIAQPDRTVSTQEQLQLQIKSSIREIPNFPKPGILFKDITPLLSNPGLTRMIVQGLTERYQHQEVDAIVGIESRGFLFGMLLAYELSIPFIPIRKKGKLPFETLCESYQLEYGEASLEIHTDAITPGARILVHDDLLATGGTIDAACKLISRMGGVIIGCSFIANLEGLGGGKRLLHHTKNIECLANYE